MGNLNQQFLNAVGQKDFETVKKLLSQGADIDSADKWGNTALSNAVWEGDVKTMDFLYDLGAKIEHKDINLLCHAAFNAQIESVKWLINKEVNADYSLEQTGENALHFAISKKSNMDKRTEIVQILVEAGTDVNKETIKGRETSCFMRDAFLKGETPLHRATAYGDEKMIQILLAAGADPSKKDANGDTPISWGSWHLRPSSVLGLLLYGNIPGWFGFPNPNLNGEDLK